MLIQNYKQSNTITSENELSWNNGYKNNQNNN